MITILSQASLIIIATLCIYRFLLEKETRYTLNRWILFSCMILAFILPQLKVDVSIPYEISQYFVEEVKSTASVLNYTRETLSNEVIDAEVLILPEIDRQSSSASISTPPKPIFNWPKILLGIYFLGASFMLARFILNLLSLIHHIQILPKEKLGKYTLLKLQKGEGSYSFFNYLFINSQKLDHSTLSQVLSHEGIHADQKHSIDILLSEMLIIILWFNPFAWIYKQKVKQNLEYLTDAAMLKKGADKTDYQFSLLRVSASGLASRLVLNYSQSLLKKRILMMNAKKSSFFSSWKYASLLPLLILSSVVLVAEKAPEIKFPETTPEVAPFTKQLVKTENSPAEVQPEIEKAIIPLNFPSHATEGNNISGTWEAKIKEEEVCMRIIRSLSDKEWNWMNFDCYGREQFSPSVSISSTSFSLERKAGKIEFNGSFTEMKGEGDFSFKGSEAYRGELVGKGIKNASEDLLFRIFFTRNEKKFVANLIELNKLGVDDQSLESLMVNGVKAELVKGYQEEGVSVSENINFLRSRVKAGLLKSYMEAGLDLEEHKGFINSRVKPDLLIAYKDAGYDLEEQKSFINSRVKPRILKEYEEAGLDLEENRQLINSRVKASLISEYQKVGLDVEKNMKYLQSRVKPSLLIAYQDAGLDWEEYNSFIQSRVKPELLLAYKEAGLDIEENKGYIHSRVKPSLLTAYEQAGLDLETHNSFIQSRVKPELLIAYKEAGLDLEENKSFIHARVKPSLLASYHEAGLDVQTYKSFIQSRVDANILTSYMQAGLDIEKHKKFIQSRVKASTLKDYQESGYDLDTYKKYIHSRVSVDFLDKYKDAGFDPLKYGDYVHNRIRPDLLTSYKEAGLDIEEHKDFIMDRVSPDKVLKYREAQKKKN